MYFLQGNGIDFNGLPGLLPTNRKLFETSGLGLVINTDIFANAKVQTNHSKGILSIVAEIDDQHGNKIKAHIFSVDLRQSSRADGITELEKIMKGSYAGTNDIITCGGMFGFTPPESSFKAYQYFVTNPRKIDCNTRSKDSSKEGILVKYKDLPVNLISSHPINGKLGNRPYLFASFELMENLHHYTEYVLISGEYRRLYKGTKGTRFYKKSNGKKIDVGNKWK